MVYYFLGRRSQLYAASWLTLASLGFYGWWSPQDLTLLIGSILFNYSISQLQLRPSLQSQGRSKLVLFFGVSANLLMLFHYKYSAFLAANLNELLGLKVSVLDHGLPLGISFFTFTQIAYLVDTYRERHKPFNLAYYSLFVTYFPHLVAGPILHHREMLPQFSNKAMYTFRHKNIAIGLTIFLLGLSKKLFLADHMARFVDPVFSADASLNFFEAWFGALAYTLQIYFDFSGYSDMAVGLGRMLGAKVPINFDSPYKAKNIIDFWRRWHITLSRFLRDYLYISLGGNRKGKTRRYVNLMTTMILGGLWHGAGWTFVVWGLLHGIYLCINHAWSFITQAHKNPITQFLGRQSQWVTFIAVVFAWVFFRAESMESALAIIEGMLGFNGFSVDKTAYFDHQKQLLPTLILLFVAFKMPNTQEWVRYFRPGFKKINAHPASLKIPAWRPRWWLALAFAILFAACLIQMKNVKSAEFIYYNF